MREGVFVKEGTDKEHLCSLSECTEKQRIGSKWVCPLTGATLGYVESVNLELVALKSVSRRVSVDTPAMRKMECQTILSEFLKKGFEADEYAFYASEILKAYSWVGCPKNNFRAFVFAVLLGFAQKIETSALTIPQDKKIEATLPPLRNVNIKQRDVTRMFRALKKETLGSCTLYALHTVYI